MSINNPLGKIDCFGMTKKHPRFRRNADRFVIADVRPAMCIHDSSENTPESARLFGGSQGQLLVIADGVGERNSAARGSALAVDTLNQHLLNACRLPSGAGDSDYDTGLFDEFSKAIHECRSAMQQEVEVADRFDEMGAVLTVIYIDWPSAYVMHVGNNRAYHWRQQHVDQVTNDHTIARRLVDAGQLSMRRANESPLRNIVWNFVGTQTEEVQPQCKEMELHVGDAMVLCSDGMTSVLNDRQISDILSETGSAEETCKAMFDEAETKGLKDDATAVVARFPCQQQASKMMEVSDDTASDTPVTIPTAAPMSFASGVGNAATTN